MCHDRTQLNQGQRAYAGEDALKQDYARKERLNRLDATPGGRPYPSEGVSGGLGGEADAPYQPSLREQMTAAARHHHDRAATLERAIAALDADPEFEKHETTRALIARTGFL